MWGGGVRALIISIGRLGPRRESELQSLHSPPPLLALPATLVSHWCSNSRHAPTNFSTRANRSTLRVLTTDPRGALRRLDWLWSSSEESVAELFFCHRHSAPGPAHPPTRPTQPNVFGQ